MEPTGKPLLSATPERLVSLDAYRGFVMLAMVSGGLGLARLAQAEGFKENPFWRGLGYQFDHVAWTGCAFWDLIQPSFMFMVGVALAYSAAARKGQGQSYLQMLVHAAWRAIVLILVGVFLRSNGSLTEEKSPYINWMFTDVTSQIGMGYLFLFLLWGWPRWVQATAAGLVLFGYWLLFALWPLPAAGFDFASVGVPPEWEHLTGFGAHWDKNTNPAAAFDVWFMNLFPRPKPFVFEGGGYQTLNFIPSLATMIFGLLAGELLRSNHSGRRKFWTLVAAGCSGLIAGLILHYTNLCPIVKRIWTPSWAIYSTGWTCLMLSVFYAVIDLGNLKKLAFPLAIVGMNSVAIYCLNYLIRGWILITLQRYLGTEWYTFGGWLNPAYKPLWESLAALLVLWLIMLWMYRRKVFLRI